MNSLDNPALLILDLDETLIYATPKLLAREADFSVFNYSVYIRPHLHDFLQFVKPHYQLAI
jgi:TFIIF-interacting CTD phosphatase-like protein